MMLFFHFLPMKAVSSTVVLFNFLVATLTSAISFFGPESSDTGIHIDQIKDALAAQGYGADVVTRAVADLSNEGHIYSTIDENHFQAS
jgi:hypothetical protein